jgi:AcrR family transcriptional regulator
MIEDGYAAVTSRRVAATAGVKPQLVHYYFRTMDDLFLALFRRGAEANLTRQEEALRSDHPLHELWKLSCEPAGTRLMFEFIALANHRKAIRKELAQFAERFRQRQLEVLAPRLAHAGCERADGVVALVLGTAISRVLAMEATLEMTVGHPETRAWVEAWLDRLEPTP